MGVEIEKKYRLTPARRQALTKRLREIGALPEGRDFEENILYAGPNLDARRQVLRLRRVGDEAILAYKERSESDSAIKHQREDETRIENATALVAILDALGYRPALIYEKRRARWRVGGTEVLIDELPFGLFLEIEGDEDEILKVEGLLDLSGVEVEMDTYPELAQRQGERRGELVESRFQLSLPQG